MTTMFLTMKFARSIFHCCGVPTRNRVLGQFSSLPPTPNPLKNTDLIFIVVSPSLSYIKSGDLQSLPFCAHLRSLRLSASYHKETTGREAIDAERSVMILLLMAAYWPTKGCLIGNLCC